MTLMEYKDKKMQNSEFVKVYEEIQSELDAIRSEIDQRLTKEQALKESNSIVIIQEGGNDWT